MLVCLLRGGSRLPKTAPAPSAEATDAEAHPTSTCFGADFRANTTPDSWTSAVHRAPCLANCRTHPDLGMGRPRSRALTSRATKKACGRRALAQRLALEHHEGGLTGPAMQACRQDAARPWPPHAQCQAVGRANPSHGRGGARGPDYALNRAKRTDLEARFLQRILRRRVAAVLRARLRIRAQ